MALDEDRGDLVPAAADLPALFDQEGGIAAVVARIEADVRSEHFEPDTADGRKRMRSLAARVSSAKVAIDEAGMALTEEARKRVNAVNAIRKESKERLEALRDEVKAPAVEWERKEQARLDDLNARLAAIQTQLDHTASVAALADDLARVEAIETGEDWQEFRDLAVVAKAEAKKEITAAMVTAQEREDREAELAKLRAAEAERERAEAARAAVEAAIADMKPRAGVRSTVEEIDADTRRIQRIARADESDEPSDETGRGRIEAAREDALATLADFREVAVERAERAAEDRRREEAEAERKREEAAAQEAQERATREAQEAEAARESAERAEAEQAERDRMTAEQAEARRAEVQAEIAAAIKPIRKDKIAAALMAGEIPHVEVTL